jgi:hypothetical protein
MLIGSDEPSGLPASSAGYTRAVLMIYDLWVTHFSNRYVWRCSVEIHRDHYRKWIGKRHLEVGVGTGYYLSGATLREVQHVALLDPNPLCLAAAKRRIGSVSCTTYCRDALLPISIPEEPFDSIAVSYLLHCLADVPHGCGYGDQHLVGEERCLSQTIPSSLPIFLADSVWSPGRIPAPAISTTAEAIKPFHQLREHHEINNSF